MGTVLLAYQNTARKCSHTLLHLCSWLMEVGHPKHTVTDSFTNLVRGTVMKRLLNVNVDSVTGASQSLRKDKICISLISFKNY